jgi:hypothetical protein
MAAMTEASLIADLRTARGATQRRYENLDPSALTKAYDWRGSAADLRFRLNWLSEGDDSARIRVLETLRRLGQTPTVAQQVLVVLGEARGRLLGALVGLSLDEFELAPVDEWNVRRTLGHVIATDQRYIIAVRYALERARSGGSGPLRPPEGSLPPRDGEAQSTGTMQDVLARLMAVRDEVVETIAAVPDDLLGAPTNWMRWDLDVRFRIHRFAAHDREHTIQLAKTRQALGVQQSEPQLLLADAMASRGALEAALHAVPDTLLERQPDAGGPSIAEILGAVLADERDL